MDFVDAIILRLADESLRGAVFDVESLSQLLSASHDVAGTGIEAPFAVVFDEITFVHDDEPRVDVAGSWMTMGHNERTELAVQASGLGAPIPRIDLLAAGAITATARSGGAKIAAVEMTWLELAGIDAEITPLPSDAVVREQRRRERLLARIRARLDQPVAFDDAALGRWLERLGAGSVTELMSGPLAAAGASLQITFGDGPDEPARRRRFPVAAAFMVRNAPLPLAGLLDETRRLRPHLNRLGFGPAGGSGGPRMRRSPIVAWVLPATLFDDEAWPGATTGSNAEKRAQRRRWAGAWLARERIGLIVPPT